MTKTTKKIMIIAAAAVAPVIVFNLLPDGVRICSTISAGAGLVAGIIVKSWWDRKTGK